MTQPEEKTSILYRVWRLYADGFRDMTVGRYLWALILVKLAIFFLVFVGALTLLFGWAEKKLDYFR